MPSRVLLTAADPSMAGILRLSQPLMQTFADAHGYEFVALEIPEGTPRDNRLLKTELIRGAFSGGVDEVLWVDADILLRRPQEEDPADYLGENDFQGLVLEHMPALNCLIPNTGLWYLRRRSITLTFLYEVMTLGSQPGPLADGGAVAKALNWHRGDRNYVGARPGLGNTFSLSTCPLPGSWNQRYVSSPPAPEHVGMSVLCDPHALHFAGLHNKVREPLMLEELQRIFALV